MSRFHLILGMRWITVFVIVSVTMAIGFATVVSGITYIYKGMPTLDTQSWEALVAIWFFWLSIGYGIGMIAGLVTALGNILYRCINAHQVVLVSCKDETIENFELKPYFKFWRKWFFTLIWINAAQVTLLIVCHKLIFGGEIWLGWFNGWGMGIMILISGVFSLILMLQRSKRVKIQPCN